MIFLAKTTEGYNAALPLEPLYRLTDSTGIRRRLDPRSGYSLEDNALALIAAIRAHALTRENGLLDYIRHYVAYVEAHFESSRGAAVWALGFAANRSAQVEVRLRALELLDRSLPVEPSWEALLGLREWVAAEPSQALQELLAEMAKLAPPRARLSASLPAHPPLEPAADYLAWLLAREDALERG